MARFGTPVGPTGVPNPGLSASFERRKRSGQSGVPNPGLSALFERRFAGGRPASRGQGRRSRRSEPLTLAAANPLTPPTMDQGHGEAGAVTAYPAPLQTGVPGHTGPLLRFSPVVGSKR